MSTVHPFIDSRAVAFYMRFGMEIEFLDQRLALIQTDRAAETRLPCSVISLCRKKLFVLRAVPDAHTLRNWRSLRYERLVGDRSSQHSIRLSDQWQMIFELDESRSPPAMIILTIDDLPLNLREG
jgi:proteic killer suppression protein